MGVNVRGRRSGVGVGDGVREQTVNPKLSGDLNLTGSLDDRGARFTDGLVVERLIGSSNIVVIV